MENTFSVLISTMTLMLIVLKLQPGLWSEPTSVGQIQFLMDKQEITTPLQLQRKEECGFSNKHNLA